MKTLKGFQFKFKVSLLKNKEKAVFQMKFKGSLLENSLLLREGHTFVSFRKMLAHITERKFLYSKSTDLNVNTIQKHLGSIQNNISSNILALWLSQFDA